MTIRIETRLVPFAPSCPCFQQSKLPLFQVHGHWRFETFLEASNVLDVEDVDAPRRVAQLSSWRTTIGHHA